MSPLPNHCARCGSADVEERLVEKLIRAGSNVLALTVPAAVCQRCGERYFDLDTVATFEEARKKLERDDLEGYRAVGHVLRPAADR